MATATETPTSRDIIIQGESFAVSLPYSEGHTLTAVEAKVLNQTRCENIRNNQAKGIKEAQAAGTYDHKATTKLVNQYDADYTFAMPGAGTARRSMDPIEKEARAIARQMLVGKLKEANRKLKDLDKAKVAEVIEKWSALDAVLKAAKKVVAERTALADVSLEEIGA